LPSALITSEASARRFISKSLFEILIDLGEKKEPKKNPIIAPGSLNKVYPKITNSHLFILK
jgi:hypothetical protein